MSLSFLESRYQPQVSVYHSTVELRSRGCERNDYVVIFCETREAAEDLADAFTRAGCIRLVDV